jgi:hypothetical protein
MRVVLHAPVGGERPSNPCGKACFGNLGGRPYVPIWAAQIRAARGRVVLIVLAARSGEAHMFATGACHGRLPAGDRPQGEA